MYALVKEFLLASVTITNKWAVFATYLAAFTTYLTEIYSLSAHEQPGSQITTSQKAEIRTALIKIIQIVNEKCRGYARSVDNKELLFVFKPIKKELGKLSAISLLAFGDAILLHAAPLVSVAGGFDLTAGDIELLTSLLNQFRTIFPKPKGNIKLTKKQTARLDQLFGLSDGELEKMDDVIFSGRSTLPDFCSAYAFKREIVKLPKHVRAFILQLNEQDGGKGMNLVKVWIWLKDHPESKIRKKTGKKGGVVINHLADGIYQFEVTHMGYVKVSGTFAITSGEMTKVVVNMVKAAL